MPYGTHKLTHAASTAAAWHDWETLQSWCEQNGHGDASRHHRPNEGAGHKTVDRQIERLRVALGAPAGAWETVLDGLTPAQREQQQPDDQRERTDRHPEQRVEEAAKRPSEAELADFVRDVTGCPVTLQQIYQMAHEAWPNVDWGKTQNWRAVQRCVRDLTRDGVLQSRVNASGQEAYQAAQAQREPQQHDVSRRPDPDRQEGHNRGMER